jgi:hypothetical protein
MIELIIIALLLGWSGTDQDVREEAPIQQEVVVPDAAVNIATVIALAEVLTAITKTSTTTATAQEIIEGLNTSTATTTVTATSTTTSTGTSTSTGT